uniref:Uncharacterized protein n=1 Tax=uncultured Methanosarcinales archaeon TaxID=183757 RepID=A0A7H1KNU6_9EURY|nr:hypothetical protein BFFPPMPJ_00015 [uncultured Methanosarcinales archaeon]
MHSFVDVVLKLEKKSRRHRHYRGLLNMTLIFLLLYTLLLYVSTPVIFARYSSYDFTLLEYPVRMKLLCTAAAALIPAIVITSLLYIRRKPVSVIRSIGDTYPLLEERLPTAYDNADSSGIIVDDLAEGVSIDAVSVRRSAIIGKKGLFLRMVASLVLVSLLMFISSPDAPRFMTPEELESMITPPTDEEREEAADEAHQQQLMSELGSESGSGSSDVEIYGKPSVAVIEGTNIELVMFSDAGVGHSSRRTESEPISFISGTVYAATPVSSETYIDRLPEENRDLIKQYFMEMAEIG